MQSTTQLRTISMLALCLLGIASALVSGCKSEKGGETVAPPPRDLAEKSLRMGKAPVAPPGGNATNGQAAP